MFILTMMPSPSESGPPRGAFLSFMHNFYAIYLGVTPPTPENEKKVAALIIGGILLLLLLLAGFTRLLLGLIFSR
jgi:hypothetical protein